MIGKESKRKKERKKVLEKVIELAVCCAAVNWEARRQTGRQSVSFM